MKVNMKFFRNWEFFLIIGLPVLLLPLLFIADDELIDGRPSTKFKCGYVLLLMAVFWMVEAMPLAITSLIPMVLLPLLGVQDTAKVSMNYMKETNMMFIGGLVIALAVEHCNLHRRIALKVMTTVGSSPIRLMFGMMLTTMFLSMWMSNTATTAMVVPIAIAVMDELDTKSESRKRRNSIVEIIRRRSFSEGTKAIYYTNHPEPLKELSNTPHPLKEHRIQIQRPRDNIIEVTETSKFLEFDTDESKAKALKKRDMKKMLLMSTALASNVGGTAVITGTGSNLIFQEIIKSVDISQGGKFTDISFATWMIYNIPPMLVNILIIWAYLVVVYYGIPNWVYFWKKETQILESEEDKATQAKVEKMLKEKYEALGSMSFHEKAVFTLFITVVFLWLFREPKFMKGWADLIPSADVGDSTAAIFIVLLLFIVPKDFNAFFKRTGKKDKVAALLDWKFVQHNLAWGVVLLMGGGFALSDAAVHSGLSQWLGQHLNGLQSLPREVILILVMFLTAIFTEVSSNAACANVILPILIALSKGINLHPLYLTIPATVTCSYAFLLPVATPPNAIVFAAGNGDISIMDMVKIGAFPNVICMLVIYIAHLSYGNLMFDFDNFVYADAVDALVANNTIPL